MTLMVDTTICGTDESDLSAIHPRIYAKTISEGFSRIALTMDILPSRVDVTFTIPSTMFKVLSENASGLAHVTGVRRWSEVKKKEILCCESTLWLPHRMSESVGIFP